MPQLTCGGWRTACRSQIYATTYIPGMEIRLGLQAYGKCLSLMSHLAGIHCEFWIVWNFCSFCFKLRVIKLRTSCMLAMESPTELHLSSTSHC